MIWVIIENVLDIFNINPLSINLFKLIFNSLSLFFKLVEVLDEFIETDFGEIFIVLNIRHPI